MRTSLGSSLVLAFVLAACGGAASSGGGGSGGGTGGGGSGSEVAHTTDGETDGFDMDGFEHEEPRIEHGTASAIELLGINPPPTPFDEMSREDQEYYMVAFVLPIAAEQFRGYDAERYAAMECATCHGDDAEEHDYAMPSRYLPRLPAMGTPEWTAMTARPAYTFMNETVTPTVRTQLGEPAYDPATGTGFGCYSCHPHS